MATTYNKMLLDINEKPSDIITAVQNDTNSRYLDVLLYDNGTPIDLTGCEVKIFMEKPEKGGEIWNDGVITDAENGRCEFLLTTEALTHFGHLQVQISIWKDNVEILSSQIFEIIVTKSLLGNSSVEASNEYGTLVVLFQNLYEAHALMTTMVENIGVPAEVAAQYDLETMWQAWEFMVAYLKGDLTDKIDDAILNSSTQGVLDKLDEEIAKEETSQEILANVKDLTPSVDGRFVKYTGSIRPKTGTQTTTVLDIVGKGTFQGCVLLEAGVSLSNITKINLQIDGVSYSCGIKGSLDTSHRTLSILPADSVTTYGSGSSGYYTPDFRFVTITQYRQNVTCLNFGEIATIGTDNSVGTCLFDKEIPFNESLKIVVETGAPSSQPQFVAWYTLDE